MEKLTKKKLSDYPLNIRVIFYSHLFFSFLCILFFASQARQVYFIIENVKFITICSGIGAIFGVLLVMVFRALLKPIIAYAPFIKSIVVLFIISTIFLGDAFGCYINHRFAVVKFVVINTRIVGKKVARAKGRYTYTIDIESSTFDKNLAVPIDLYDRLHEGQYIAVKIRKGKLGFDFIDWFN